MARYCSIAYTAALEALRGYSKAMVAQVEPLRAEDADAIHDMRVASRRLRAALAEYGALFEKAAMKPFRAQVRQVTRELSRVRELDVSISMLEKHRNALKGPARIAANYVLRRLRILRRKESPKTTRCADWVASTEFNDLFQTLLHSFGRRKQCQIKNAKRRVTKHFNNVVGIYTRWTETQSTVCRRLTNCEEDLHQLRIAFKKLRYTCEVYQKTYGQDMGAFISRLKQAQDWIGDWHDHFILQNSVKAFAPQAPPTSAAGMARLKRMLKQEGDALLADFAQGARAFFDPGARQTALDTFGALRHDCCWSKPSKSMKPPREKVVPSARMSDHNTGG